MVGAPTRSSERLSRRATPRRRSEKRLLSESLTPLRRSLSFPADGSFGGLPQNIRQFYANRRKISRLYDWQERVLSDNRLSSGSNLILSLPTGGGKTLLAELIMLKEILTTGRSCILILPFVAIVQEKVNALAEMGDQRFCIEEYAGTKGRIPPIARRKRCSLYVATIEKANLLINSLIEKNRLEQIGLVVVDELHMIAESDRGAILEQALAKFLYRGCGRILGMSATLAGTSNLCRFLRAEMCEVDFRPIPLQERVKIENTIYRVDAAGHLHFEAEIPTKSFNNDRDGLILLIKDVLANSNCLIFCPTKKNAENICQMIAQLAPKWLRDRRKADRQRLVAQLDEEAEGGHSNSLLCQCLLKGIAFHHSGLTAEERAHIESAYQDGLLSVICCTSTLAAGVNLAAGRVVIRAPMVATTPLNQAQYKQMVGRAGRAGFCTAGDSYTIVQPGAQEVQFREMLKTPFSDIASAMSKQSIAGFLLDAFTLKLIDSRKSANELLQKTLFGIERNLDEIDANLNETLAFLIEYKMLSQSKDSFIATEMGCATYSANFSVAQTSRVMEQVQKAIGNGLVLSSHFHLLLLVVPEQLTDTGPLYKIDWHTFYVESDRSFQFCALSADEQQLLGDRFGLGEGQLVRFVKGYTPPDSIFGQARRIYLALMMRRLWNQESIGSVAERFAVTRGWLQSALQLTCGFAGALSRFAERITELWPLRCLLPELVNRLLICAKQELQPLMRVDCVRRGRAQQLYSAGYRSLGQLAAANAADLSKEIEHLGRAQAARIIISAQTILRDEIAERVEQMDELAGDSKQFLSDLVEQMNG